MKNNATNMKNGIKAHPLENAIANNEIIAPIPNTVATFNFVFSLILFI